MSNEVLNLTYKSSITDLKPLNSSFDKGILQICYPGENRNKTYFSKSTLEKCIPTLYNVPVVCNYYREDGSIGGHDVEVIHDYDDSVRLVNLTQPVGVVPESSNIFFKEVTEEDGTVNEYLCCDVLLWKRQEAYKAIKENGITAQSMEISVFDGARVDDVYVVNDFEFTALTLLGDCEPCFESASLHLFSDMEQNFKLQFAEMMRECKDLCNSITTSPSEVENIDSQSNHSRKGGCQTLEQEVKDVVEFETNEEPVVEPVEEAVEEFTVEEAVEATTEEEFALQSNLKEEIYRALECVTIETEWGVCPQFGFMDYDPEIMEIYCWDHTDWLLYGFKYEMSGDAVVIDFESKKRVKYVIADFEEGETQDSPFMNQFSELQSRIVEANANISTLESNYAECSANVESMTTELEELRQYRLEHEVAADTAAREEIFSRFEDIAEVEEFVALVERASEYSLDELEEKCFAIRGRNVKMNFSKEVKSPKLPVKTGEIENITKEPYGGVVEKYRRK